MKKRCYWNAVVHWKLYWGMANTLCLLKMFVKWWKHIPWKKIKKSLYEVKLLIGWGHFSVDPEVPISQLGQTTQFYNVAVRGPPVLRTKSLPSLSRYPFIHLVREEQVRVKCLAQGHNTRTTQGLNSQPCSHEFGTLPLSYACLSIRIWECMENNHFNLTDCAKLKLLLQNVSKV